MIFQSNDKEQYDLGRLLAEGLQDEDGYGKDSVYESGNIEQELDYSVLAVGVTTLAMLLFVEVIRHKLDHLAVGRPFFKRVLDGVYSELSTLGVVEFVVFLILKYVENIDKAKKGVFADVHFAFFYTAIFNAFQSVIVALVTRRNSERLWFSPEHFSLDHYVEIREEFDRVQAKYFPEGEGSGPFSLRKFLHRQVQNIRRPGLRRRYLDLLVQVKFHQLRLHFLEGNNLPVSLKVSEYLKRSEQRVLMKLIHVSSGAWLMLTGGLTLIYFLMGMIAFVIEEKDIMGSVLTCIFFCILVVFILICLALYVKMNTIFKSIILMKQGTMTQSERREEGVKFQLKLFWFGEPQVVISIIQFMQFGYALALAIVIMYWESLKGALGIQPYWYLAAVLGCYGIFVYVLSYVMPQFTLCTSLGYLVDQSNLQEAVALHRLSEERRFRLRKKEMTDFEADSTVAFDMDDDDSGDLLLERTNANSNRQTGRRTDILAELVKSDTTSLRGLLPIESRQTLQNRERQRRRNRKSMSDGVALMREMGRFAIGLPDSDLSRITSKPTREQTLFQKVPNRVGLPTRAVDDTVLKSRPRELSPVNSEQKNLVMQQRASRIAQRRRNRKKSQSESAIIQEWHKTTPTPSGLVIEADKQRTTSQYNTLPLLDENQPSEATFVDGRLEEIHSTKSGRGDASTMNMEDSDEELSDVDVKEWDQESLVQSLPEDLSCMKKFCKNLAPKTICRNLRNYLLTQTYSNLSNVFGSLVAFYLVGNRVEVMLASTGILKSSENTWELSLGLSFWLEAAFYIEFLLGGIITLLLFLPLKEKAVKQRVLIAASGLDILLSGTCLTLLFLAEAQRCCEDKGDIDMSTECCASWGSRTYGGLGDLEPFTCLIALRIFRFPAGSALIKLLDERKGMSGVHNENTEEKGEDQTDHSKNTVGAMQADIGTPLELWEKAIGKYPDVVSKYGQFSTELFQCMLGLEVMENVPSPETVLRTSIIVPPMTPIHEGESEEMPDKRQSMKIGKKYERLPSQAQSIIVAGKLGKPVRSSMKRSSTMLNLSTLVQEPVFQIDDDQIAREERLESKFTAPNARLLRSMRRCDRKLLPMLKKWTCVDIVMTQFELVYFEAIKSPDPSKAPSPENASLIALQATSGGKGLRLQDVAAGRKIVGRLDLSEVTEVHVERSMPVSDPKLEDCDALYDKNLELPTEYWSKKSKVKDESQFAREVRWEKIKEDRLTLVSLHGQLIIRFYSDLDDVELHAVSSATEDEESGPIRKNIAFQWAQTISHACGKDQLRQQLPHLGANDSDELRDFLEVSNYHEMEHEAELKKLKTVGLFSSVIHKTPDSPKYRRAKSVVLGDDSIKKRMSRRLTQINKIKRDEDLAVFSSRLSKAPLSRKRSSTFQEDHEKSEKEEVEVQVDGDDVELFSC